MAEIAQRDATDHASGEAASRPLRLGLIGCGRLGTGFYIPAMAAADGVELTAIAEPDLGRSLDARSAAAAAVPGAVLDIHMSAERLLESRAIDGVVIAGPASTHPEQARLAAEAGIPCLVEKPPAEDLAGALELAAAGDSVRVGFNRRFAVGPQRLAAMREGLEAGGSVDLQLHYLGMRWRPFSGRAPILEDIGIHLADLALLLLGEGRLELRCERLGGRRASFTIRAREQGRSARIDLASARPWRESVVARDTAGKELASYATGGPRPGIEARLGRGPDPLTGSLIAQMESFARLQAGASEPLLASSRDAVAAMAALDTARLSADAGGAWIDLASSGSSGVPA